MINTTLATHSLETMRQIYEGSLSRKYCEQIVEAYKDLEKIDNTGNNQDNLFRTERTGWRAHEDNRIVEVASQLIEPFAKTTGDVLPVYFKSVKVNLFESWIARSKDGAFVEPHNHGRNNTGTQWSYVFYADIPNGESSIVFFDSIIGRKIKVPVKTGDYLIFPSDLMHYTTDTCEGRMILSGNFAVSLDEEGEDEAS